VAEDRRELEAFVRSHVRSAEELEALLLLFRDPARSWRVWEVAQALRLQPDAARRALERLSGAFLEVRIENELRFRFATLNSGRERLTASLERAYQGDRSWLMRLVGGAGSARDFADAFRLRKDDDS
jgi:hypothetical protein